MAKHRSVLLAHEIYGFESLSDFLHTLTGYRNRRIVMWDFIIMALGLITTFITKFIWTDQRQFYTIIGLVAVDVFLGTRIAWTRNNFQTRRFLRSLWVLVYYTIALGVVNNYAKINTDMKLLVPITFFWLSGKTFISILKNLALLGVPLPPKLKSLVMDKVDNFKNEDSPLD